MHACKIITFYYRDHFDAEVKTWDQLPAILNEGDREIVEVEGQGYKLLECLQKILQVEYNTFYSPIQMIEMVSQELINNPHHTKYYQTPPEIEAIRTNMNNVMGNKFGRLLVDVYLPALSTALDLHIKICQEVHGYVSVVTTKPLTQSENKKFAMLLWENDTYKMILRKGIQIPQVNTMDITMDHPYIQNSENIMTPDVTTNASKKTTTTTTSPTDKSNQQKSNWNDEEVIKKFKEIYKSTNQPQQKLSKQEVLDKMNKVYGKQHGPKSQGKGVKGRVKSTNENGEGDKEIVHSTTSQETPTKSPEDNINSPPGDTSQETHTTLPEDNINSPLGDNNTKAPMIQPSTNKNDKKDYREIQSGDTDEEGLINSSTDLLKQASQLVNDIQESLDKEYPPLPNMPDSIAKRKIFDMSKFKKIDPEVVESIPHDINGTKMYIMDCSGSGDINEWQKKYKDRRYFKLNTSKRKGFRGLRRIRKCCGNYQCTNKECPILQTTGKPNKHKFKKIGGKKFCFSCDDICFQQTCYDVKCIEYSQHKNLLVYHDGNHTCQEKPNNYEHDDYIEKCLRETGGRMGPKELAQMKMTSELEKQRRNGSHDMAPIVEIASRMTDKKKISNMKK